jgi:hypothetical protein
MKGKRHWGNSLMMLLFALFWSGLTLVALSAALWGTGQQLVTCRFVETQGEILESEVVDQGKTDGFRVSYRYSVNGTTYEGARLRYGGGNGESGDWAIKMKAQFAAGSKIPVFYEPSAPNNAVLVRGIEGVDLFALQFLTPFAVVMLALWREVVRRLTRKFSRSETMMDALTAARGEILGTATHRPLEAALTFLALAAFLGCFPIVFTVGFHPPLGLALGSWALLLVIAGCGGMLASRVKQPEWQQAKLDYARRVLVLPALNQRRGERNAATIAFSDIESVSVVSRSASGLETEEVGPFFLRIQAHQSAAHELGDWPQRTDAESVASLLVSAVGTPPAKNASAGATVAE